MNWCCPVQAAAHGKDLSMFYVLSTWNPYVVVLMQSHFQISGL